MPLRIFLSNGHNSNEPLGSLIKINLEKRGHDVWIDKNEMKSGNYCWRFSTVENQHEPSASTDTAPGEHS